VLVVAVIVITVTIGSPVVFRHTSLYLSPFTDQPFTTCHTTSQHLSEPSSWPHTLCHDLSHHLPGPSSLRTPAHLSEPVLQSPTISLDPSSWPLTQPVTPPPCAAAGTTAWWPRCSTGSTPPSPTLGTGWRTGRSQVGMWVAVRVRGGDGGQQTNSCRRCGSHTLISGHSYAGPN
jgi:hypothetical protein